MQWVGQVESQAGLCPPPRGSWAHSSVLWMIRTAGRPFTEPAPPALSGSCIPAGDRVLTTAPLTLFLGALSPTHTALVSVCMKTRDSLPTVSCSPRQLPLLLSTLVN